VIVMKIDRKILGWTPVLCEAQSWTDAVWTKAECAAATSRESARAQDDCDAVLHLMSRGAGYQQALTNVRTADGWERVDAGNAAWRARLFADVEAADVGADAGVTFAGMLAAGFALIICLVTSVWLVNWFAATMAVSP
jgi:hypothetical protein